MHVMLQYILHLHRTEGSKSHMEGHSGNLHSLCLNLLQQFIGEMKTGRRCSRRTVMLCIDGLITVLILQHMGNVGGQRHLAQLIQHFLKNALVFELNQSISLLDHIHYRSNQFSVTEGNYRARLCFLSGLHQGLPDIIFLSFQQKHLDACTGPFLHSVESGRNHSGVIDHQTVSGI